jgi:hypothetical protein
MSQYEPIDIQVMLVTTPQSNNDVKDVQNDNIDIEPPRDKYLREALRELASEKYSTDEPPSSSLLTPDYNPPKGRKSDVKQVPVTVVNQEYDLDDTESEADCVCSTFARKIEQVPEPAPVEEIDTQPLVGKFADIPSQQTNIHAKLSEKPLQVLESDELTSAVQRHQSLKKRLMGIYDRTTLAASLRGIKSDVQAANPDVDVLKLATKSLQQVEAVASNTLEYLEKKINRLKSMSDPK